MARLPYSPFEGATKVSPLESNLERRYHKVLDASSSEEASLELQLERDLHLEVFQWQGSWGWTLFAGPDGYGRHEGSRETALWEGLAFYAWIRRNFLRKPE